MDIAQVIDTRPLSVFQLRTIVLCALVALSDGFDTQILAYVAPRMAPDIGMAPSSLGLLVSLGLAGMVVSGLLGGIVADRFGRRPVILGSLLLFSLATVAKGGITAFAAMPPLQLLAGLGLGSAYVNALALTGEYAPARIRRFAVTCASTAYPLGGILASYVSAAALPGFGWRMVFIGGGAVSFGFFLLSVAFLPASVRQLLLPRRASERVTAIMARIAPDLSRDTVWISSEVAPERVPLLELFTADRFMLTVLLAVAVTSTLTAAYFVTSWSPTLLARSGVALGHAIILTGLLHGGAVIGSLIWAWLADRNWPPAVIGAAAAITAIGLSAIGHFTGVYSLLFMACFLGGVGMGVQNAYYGLIAAIYPTAIRGTALGFIIGVGRVGSIAGPLMGGALLARHWSTAAIYHVAGGLSLVSLACMILASTLAAPRRLIARSRSSVTSNA